MTVTWFSSSRRLQLCLNMSHPVSLKKNYRPVRKFGQENKRITFVSSIYANIYFKIFWGRCQTADTENVQKMIVIFFFAKTNTDLVRISLTFQKSPNQSNDGKRDCAKIPILKNNNYQSNITYAIKQLVRIWNFVLFR